MTDEMIHPKALGLGEDSMIGQERWAEIQRLADAGGVERVDRSGRTVDRSLQWTERGVLRGRHHLRESRSPGYGSGCRTACGRARTGHQWG